MLVVNFKKVFLNFLNLNVLEGRLLSSQSEQFKKYSKSSDWLKKSRFCFNHVNRLMVALVSRTTPEEQKLTIMHRHL